MHRNGNNPQRAGQTPNLLLTGISGMGKAAVAKMLIVERPMEQCTVTDGVRDGVS